MVLLVSLNIPLNFNYLKLWCRQNLSALLQCLYNSSINSDEEHKHDAVTSIPTQLYAAPSPLYNFTIGGEFEFWIFTFQQGFVSKGLMCTNHSTHLQYISDLY